ncbi:MAG: alpha/beta hydrolase-fold protein, partial [Pseudobdellovibrio sp.]
MLKNKIETRGVRNWNYERFNFQSTILNQEVQCGLLRPDSKAEIQRTFYILHGGDGDDTQAVQAGLLPVLDDILTQGSHKHVQIVFPYIGSSFLHNPPSLTSKSFSSYFLNEILPACEAGTTTQDRSRYLCGWSMGGQAALSMFIRAMDLFGGVGVHFPTLINSNYNDKGQQAAYA